MTSHRLAHALPLVLLAGLWLAASACRAPVRAVSYSADADGRGFAFAFADTTGDAYLRELRRRCRLDSVVAGATTDLERVAALTHWAHGLWEHSGWNEPAAYDARSILDEVAAGERFRCVEYAIVIREAAQALGMQARCVGLQTADVETRRWGAGHVVAEVYCREHDRWVFADGQGDAVALRNGRPLSAVELGLALREGPAEVTLLSGADTLRGEPSAAYLAWVAPYLHFFNTGFDTRPRPTRVPPGPQFDGHSVLYLVPEGEQGPRVFQRKSPVRAAYTSSLRAFYPSPE